MIADSSLSGLTIGSLSLSPTFDPEVLEYAVSTGNASNKVTATAADENAEVTIMLGDSEITNGSSPSWAPGENVLIITVKNGDSETVYSVTVTKS